jgi:hypothetical protein
LATSTPWAREAKALASRSTKVQVALGCAPGLVHAKIFYIEWMTPKGQNRHTLVYGSGNATRQAFEGDINSEVMCKVGLTAKNHSSILGWITNVRAALFDRAANPTIIPPLRDAFLADSVTIRLPGMTIKDAGNKANNFDLWLQRGRLLSTFQPDPSFLRVHVNLRNELPPGAQEQIVQALGFETLKTRRLSFPYILATDNPDEESDSPGNWRSKYFTWTQLGFWSSDSCFRAHHALFRKAGHESRLQDLQRLRELAVPATRAAARSNFLHLVLRLWKGFEPEAANYLETKRGAVDQAFYTDSFDQRVERDLELANDAEFASRYINGCEVIDVPRFRTDAAAWRSFVDSFSRQIHLEGLKTKSQSKTFLYIHDALVEALNEMAFDDPGTIIKSLRSVWNKTIEDYEGEYVSVGEFIDSYQDES